ncbi:protein TPX2-like [Actinidia eriantha]|uniref:protein TPX2-like n=1 Tax=Actinidia eriantha TaxID=165200 RepID=UPI00258E01B0|nr:protein TPX2-like [Actinidia eriantha]
MAMVDESSVFMIDEAYEFSAPRFFDFMNGESEEDMGKAELWFETALSYAPSPFIPKIKTGRSVVQLESLCDFSEAEQSQKAPTSEETTASNLTAETVLAQEKDQTRSQSQVTTSEIKEEATPIEAKEDISPGLVNPVPADVKTCEVEDTVCAKENGSITTGEVSCTVKVEPPNNEIKTSTAQETCTPKSKMVSRKDKLLQTDSKRQQTAKKIASMVKNPSALKPHNRSQLSQAKSTKPPASARRETNLKNTVATPNFAQENQAIKRQKLDGGRSRQILSLKPQTLPHKSRPGLTNSGSNLCSSTAKTRKEDRKVYVREPKAAPFVSMAEMMKKFQSSTREMSLPNLNSSFSHDERKPKLTLTRPKEPEFETAQRVRSVRVKSSAELEEEMMAKIPKFKARPLNKKILETSSLPALPRSTPHLPEFQEFHLETMVRANHNAETSTIASTESAAQNHQWKFHLTAPKSPVLQTSLRARPPGIKSTEELEKEVLENIPKFKARPLNKKIFESKGDLGIFCNTKRHITVPQEFHFATDERIPPPANVADLFDKLSLCSETQHDKKIPRNTTPNPFQLHTEERGAEKERRFVTEVMQKLLEEERARIPKAHPYPYTTDYPVIPPKPEPKHCTKPEPFQLESLVRHEEEMQREMEERRRMEEEEAQMRLFKAQPILKDDPIPVPDKVRKPLTEVQEFNLHLDHRAGDRAEFDKKIKEKEMMYKRYREESESAKMMEEEKALKQLRRTLIPHARPVPKFEHTFLPQRSSKEVTKPKSPKLHVNQRKERRRYVSAVAAASSAASHMR